MRRLQLVEIEDQPWCPAVWRDALTDYLGFVLQRFAPYTDATPLLVHALDRLGETRIVDLCSGGGGPWLDLAPRLRAVRPAVRVMLTDYYPNMRAFARLRARSRGAIETCERPVDAAAVPPELEGVRTLFTAFHHFEPATARRILADAARSRRGIAIFEATSRSLVAIAGMPFFTLGALLFTPFIRPFRWSRLLWTYLVPVLPLLIWFDATVSCLRTYTRDELREMADAVGAHEYDWEVGTLRAWPLLTPLTYLIGSPRVTNGVSAEVSATV
jgi:SAM-dependent methyltransferase